MLDRSGMAAACLYSHWGMTTPDPRIRRALAVMEGRMAQPWPVAALAREVNLSPSQFRHLFRLATGTSPARYLQGLRLGRARLLLERTFLSVKEVMALVGVAD